MTDTRKKHSFRDLCNGFICGFKGLLKKLYDKKYLYPSFLLPVVIMSIVYICLSIFPYGDRSILILDMNAQYVYFFEQLRDIITSDESVLYSFERALGGEFLGIYAYYLASPLSLIVVLFPKHMITEAIKVLLLLKCGLSGLSFAYYLDKTRKRNAVGFTIFSTMYALCAYAVTFQSNIMWMDALIWLPLITLGIERVVKTGHFKLYVIALAIGIWSNYYIGYMLCIYVVLYFFCYLFAHKNDEINLLGERLHRLKSLGRIALYSLVAVMISAFVIIGGVYSLSFGKATHQSAELTFTLNYDFLDLATKLFVGSYDTVRPDGLPNIYSGILMLLMLPAYFISKHIKAREKILYALLCLVFVASFSINALNLAWHGFQPPVWLSFRYSFLFSFIALTMAYRGFEHLREIKGKTLFGIGVCFIGLLILIQKLCTIPRYIRDKDTVEQVLPDFQIIWLSIGFIILYLIVLYFSKKPKLPITMSVLLVALVSVEMLTSSLIIWTEQINDVGWASRSNYLNFVNRAEYGMDYIEENEQDYLFFRTEKTLYRKNNDAFAIDMNGVSEFTSTFNKDIITFLKRVGFVSRSQASKYVSGNEVIDSLLGIRYVIGEGPDKNDYIQVPVSDLYEKTYLEDKNLYIYKNPYALPLAYGVSSNIKNTALNYEDVYSSFEYTEIIVGAMMGLDNDQGYDLFESAPYRISYKSNCTVSSSGDQLRFIRSSSGTTSSATFTVTPSRDGSVYAYLPSPYYTKATLYVNDNFASDLFNSDHQRIVNLGNFKAGESIKVRMDFDSSLIVVEADYPLFTQINQDKLVEFTTKFNENGLNITDFKDTHIKGALNATADLTVFTSIPYDKGWNVYVDGQRVDTFEVTEAFLAFDITSGEHTIEMKYMPIEHLLGIIISIAGVILFILFILAHKKWGAPVIVTACEENDDTASVTSEEVKNAPTSTKNEFILCPKEIATNDEGEKTVILKPKEDENDISC